MSPRCCGASCSSTVRAGAGCGLRAAGWQESTATASSELAKSQALADGVTEASEDVVGAARSALSADVVRRAASRPHWRETYVGTVVGGTLVEGYIDLLFRDDDGPVIVDYKTDAVADDEVIAAYLRQLDVYRRALLDVVSEPVVRTTLLFLRPDGAVPFESSHAPWHSLPRPRAGAPGLLKTAYVG